MTPHARLEVELAQWLELEPSCVVACSSGTAAIQLALTTLRMPKGSRVLVPQCTFVACGRAVVAAGLEPVFVDCGDDLLIDPVLLKKACYTVLAPISAIMPVHIHGRRCDMEKIHDLCQISGTYLIEDMAQLHGVKPHPASDAACWSFNRTKVIAGEEGGAVWFRQEERANLARLLRNQGHDGDDLEWNHLPGGGNWRMADALAVPILASLRQREMLLAARWDSWNALGCELLPQALLCPDVPWVFDLRVPDAAGVVAELRQRGIAARRCFRPLAQMEEFSRCQTIGGRRAERAFAEVVALPLPMTEQQVGTAVEIIKQISD